MATYQDIAIPIGVGIGAWFAAAPDLAEIRQRDRGDSADLRGVELSVGVLTLGTGLAGTMITKSRGPLWAAVLVLATLFIIYEVSLRMESNNG